MDKKSAILNTVCILWLGIDVDLEAIKRHIRTGAWETPMWHFEDGSPADW